MTDQIREQVSALLDGELPPDEVGLLVRRMERNRELRGAFGRYSLIGETLRAPGGLVASPAFAARVSAAIDAPQGVQPGLRRPAASARARWGRPAFAAAIAASFALIAVIAVQPFAGREAAVVAAHTAAAPSGSALGGEASPTPARSQRLAGYLVAHSQFSSPIVRQNVWSGLLAADPGLSRVSYETVEGP